MNHKLDTDTQVFFYEQDFYVLSNFSAFRLDWQDISFDTSEHAYQWSKFAGYDDEVARAILESNSAHEAFKLAEKYKARRRPDWDGIKVRIMQEILCAKVTQHEYVRRKLLDTGDRMLIEDSWRDDFWGWGSSRSGQNMLGQVWMVIRRVLQSGDFERFARGGFGLEPFKEE